MLFLICPAVVYLANRFFNIEITLPSIIILFFVSVFITAVLNRIFNKINDDIAEHDRQKKRFMDRKHFNEEMDDLDYKRRKIHESKRKWWF